MVVTFFSIGCLICLSFFTGLFTCFYIITQIVENEEVECEFEPEIKIGYKRHVISNNQLKKIK